MSKMDGLRAMREARYQAAASRSTKPSPAPRAAPAPQRAARQEPAKEQDDASQGLCGHKAISGRTCTREQGHSAKSHRYS
jgi:hypothetical protein